MSEFSIDEFLQPISPDSPGGVDVRFLPDWKKLMEFRRADDTFNKGEWATREEKVSQWDSARDYAAQLLRTKGKDLRIAVIYAEAKFRTESISGVVDGLRLLRELAVKFWDFGLLPAPGEDGGLQTRVAALHWLNEGLASALYTLVVTERRDGGLEYTFADYVNAQAVGREKDYESGGARYDKRENFQKAKQEGRTLDLFEAAVKATPRSFYEQLVGDLELLESELDITSQVLTEQFAGPALLTPLDDPEAEIDRVNKLQEVVPGFSKVREAIRTMRGLLDPVLVNKRKEEPVTAVAAAAGAVPAPANSSIRSNPVVVTSPMYAPAETPSQHAPDMVRSKPGDPWTRAAEMVQSGEVEQGLVEMARLASTETSGRNRFQRKLMLAEICLQMNKDRLARTILEELAEQVDKHHLDEWETTDLVGGVWGHLYKIYKKDDREQDRAAKYFDRLCRLDPWQTLRCSED